MRTLICCGNKNYFSFGTRNDFRMSTDSGVVKGFCPGGLCFLFCVQFISTIFSQFIDIVPGHNELWPRRQCDIQDGQNILLENTSGKLYYAAEAQKSFDKKNHTFSPDFPFLFLLLLLFACFFFAVRFAFAFLLDSVSMFFISQTTVGVM